MRSGPFLDFAGGEMIEVVSIGVSLASTLAILIAGLLTRATAAVHQLDAWIESAIVGRAIRKQTTVRWNDPPLRVEEGTR